MPRVSVVVPAYNAARTLAETLDSVLSQDGVTFEVIVVDDGSTDATPEVIATFGDRIVAIRQANTGQSGAMNTALRAAAGDYIAYLDADDLCRPGRLRQEAHYLDDHPEALGVYTPSEYIDADGRHVEWGRPTAPDPFLLLYRNYIPHSSVMHRRECIERVGLFDTSYVNHDWDLWVRISEHGRWGVIEEPLVRYRVHGGNISRTRRRPVNHYRLTRKILLGKTRDRRGSPWWLRAMYVRAVIEWAILAHPAVSERAPKWWWRAHAAWNAVESLVIRRLAGNEVLPLPWRSVR